MLKIVSLLVGIIYAIGTSSMFHVFAMNHIHQYAHMSGHMNHTSISFNKSNCDDNNKCMQVCTLVEGNKLGILYEPLKLHIVSIYHYIPLSFFLPRIENKFLSIGLYDTYKSSFYTSLVGITKLTI